MGWFGPDVKKLQAAGDVEGLIGAIGDNSWQVRKDAVEALGEIGDERAVEPLVKALGDVHIFATVEEALGKFGEPAVEPLIKELRNDDTCVAAGRVLGEIGDERAVEPLIEILALSKGGLLTHLLGDARFCAAAKALGKIGDARAAEPLIKIFIKLNSDDSSFFGGKEEHYKAIANSLKGIPGVEAEFERLEAYDKAEEWYTFHGRLEEAAAIRRKKAEMTASRTEIHGDYIDDRDTIIKDSVISKSNIGAGGKSKAEQIKEIKELLDAGAISEEDYQKMKREIVG